MNDVTQNQAGFFWSCNDQISANNLLNKTNRPLLSEWACNHIYYVLSNEGNSNEAIMQGIPNIVFFFREDSLETLIRKYVMEDGDEYLSEDGEPNYDWEHLCDCESINLMATNDDSPTTEVIYSRNYFSLND